MGFICALEWYTLTANFANGFAKLGILIVYQYIIGLATLQLHSPPDNLFDGKKKTARLNFPKTGFDSYYYFQKNRNVFRIIEATEYAASTMAFSEAPNRTKRQTNQQI